MRTDIEFQATDRTTGRLSYQLGDNTMSTTIGVSDRLRLFELLRLLARLLRNYCDGWRICACRCRWPWRTTRGPAVNGVLEGEFEWSVKISSSQGSSGGRARLSTGQHDASLGRLDWCCASGWARGESHHVVQEERHGCVVPPRHREPARSHSGWVALQNELYSSNASSISSWAWSSASCGVAPPNSRLSWAFSMASRTSGS